MADLDTRSKRASSVNFEKPYALALVLPDGSFGQDDRQHSAWSYSGILAGAPTSPATIDYQSDGKGSGKREKRRNRTYELFTQLERTIRAELSGDTGLVPAAVESATVPRRYEAAFDQLVAAAHEYAELADRLAALRAEIRAYEVAQWEAQELDDEETWMML